MKHHPVVVAQNNPESLQLRLADGITNFAGTMRFVYIHAIIFLVWVVTKGFGADKFPFNFLTMAVSLEAIFLSTFVMIGQNRQSKFAQAKADHDFHAQDEELRTNTELTRAIHSMTTDMNKILSTKGKK